jgi:hypothetical protein
MAELRTDSEEKLVERLREACNGHPHAKIAWPHRVLHEAADTIARLVAERDEARALTLRQNEYLTNAALAMVSARTMLDRTLKAIEPLGLRTLVAGWNGEGRDGGPYARHPDQLGVTLPTTAGVVYRLDAIASQARSSLDLNAKEDVAIARAALQGAKS